MIFRTAGLFLLLVFLSMPCFAQDLDYARHSMNKLASEKFAGRGYVEQGDRKAAEYIAKEFAAHGLEKFRTDYYQGYSFPMNTFPGNVKVTIDGKKLKPGRDFLVASNCTGLKGRFDLVWIPATSPSLEAFPQASFQEKVPILMGKTNLHPLSSYSGSVRGMTLGNGERRAR